MWKIDKDSDLRFRCFTGHPYTAAALLAEPTRKIEETMWIALRMFKERKNLLTTVAHQRKGGGAKSALERTEIPQIHIDRIRAMLKTVDKLSADDMPV